MVAPETDVALAEWEGAPGRLDIGVAAANLEVLAAAECKEEGEEHELMEHGGSLVERGAGHHLFKDVKGEG